MRQQAAWLPQYAYDDEEDEPRLEGDDGGDFEAYSEYANSAMGRTDQFERKNSNNYDENDYEDDEYNTYDDGTVGSNDGQADMPTDPQVSKSLLLLSSLANSLYGGATGKRQKAVSEDFELQEMTDNLYLSSNKIDEMDGEYEDEFEDEVDDIEGEAEAEAVYVDDEGKRPSQLEANLLDFDFKGTAFDDAEVRQTDYFEPPQSTLPNLIRSTPKEVLTSPASKVRDSFLKIYIYFLKLLNIDNLEIRWFGLFLR